MPNIFSRVDAGVRGNQTRAALADLHPETTTRTHLFSTRSDDQVLAPYTYLQALVANENHVWVKKAVTIITDNACSLPLYVKQGDKRFDSHAALDRLNHPNDQMSSSDLWRWWVTDMLLGGEEGWEMIKDGRKPARYVEIWPRQPNVFSIEVDPARRRYYGVKSYEISDGKGEPYELPVDEFVHFKFFNPRNPWRGIGVMLALRLAIVIDVFAQSWEKYLFENNARPDYAVITPQGTTRTERDDIEKKLSQKFGGVSNAGKVIALEDGVTDVKPLSFRPKDLGELELRKMSRDEIAGGFGVPDILMGFGADTYDTEDKRTAAIRALYSLTIKPLLRFRDIHTTMQAQRLGMLKADEHLWTDYETVTELQEHDDQEWKRASEQIDQAALTINDWRTSKGLKPYPWGDVAWIDANKVPITSLTGGAAPAKSAIENTAALVEHVQALQANGAGQDYTPQLIDLIDRLFEAYVKASAQPHVIHIHVPEQAPVPVKFDLQVHNDVKPAAVTLPNGQPVLIQNQVVVDRDRDRGARDSSIIDGNQR